LTGISSKSYWHLSRSQATQVGMTNDWLKAQGLVSIRDLWMKAHGYAWGKSCAPCWWTARCGPACRVVWGGPVRSRPLPDWAFRVSHRPSTS